MENTERFDWVNNMDIQELTRQRDFFLIATTTAIRLLGGRMRMDLIDVINFEEGKYELHVTTDELGNTVFEVTNKIIETKN